MVFDWGSDASGADASGTETSAKRFIGEVVSSQDGRRERIGRGAAGRRHERWQTGRFKSGKWRGSPTNPGDVTGRPG
jgi:hypothetical protein